MFQLRKYLVWENCFAIPPLGKPHDQIFKLYLTLKLWYHFEEHNLKF